MYYKEHKDINVLKNYPPNPKLYEWVKTHREQFTKSFVSKEQPLILTTPQIASLKALGFKAAEQVPCIDIWENMVAKLQQYHQELQQYHQERKRGDDDANAKTYKGNPVLTTWVSEQHQQ
mmetsp:Transcript_58576/g.68427  ORF Transcript_58576/g.68427 Transcript_58576/m.68427 type:complete len:120 (-) Transcript_58576:1143-1502(-)